MIFITEKDVLGDGLPIYEIDRYVGQNQRYFGDEEHIIYVNGQYRDDTPPWLADARFFLHQARGYAL